MNNFGAKVIICYVLKVINDKDNKYTMLEVTFFITGFIALFSFVRFIF